MASFCGNITEAALHPGMIPFQARCKFQTFSVDFFEPKVATQCLGPRQREAIHSRHDHAELLAGGGHLSWATSATRSDLSAHSGDARALTYVFP